jgi:hypothetical protein
VVSGVGAASYEPVKCGNCGKTLGYVRIDVKIFPPKSWVRLVAGGPLIKVEKDVLCEECFRRSKKTNEKV